MLLLLTSMKNLKHCDAALLMRQADLQALSDLSLPDGLVRRICFADADPSEGQTAHTSVAGRDVTPEM